MNEETIPTALLRRARNFVAKQADSEKMIDGFGDTDIEVLYFGETATDRLLAEIDAFLAA